MGHARPTFWRFNPLHRGMGVLTLRPGADRSR